MDVCPSLRRALGHQARISRSTPWRCSTGGCPRRRPPRTCRRGRSFPHHFLPPESHHCAYLSMVSASVLRPSGLAKIRFRSSSRSKMAWPCVVRPRRAARPTYCSMPATDVVSAKDFVTTTVDAGTFAPQVNSLPAVTQASLLPVMLSCTHCVYTGLAGSASSFGSKEPAPDRANIIHLSSTGSALMAMNSCTLGSRRMMVGAFFGRFGHQRLRNASDWITRSDENFRRVLTDSTTSPSSAYLSCFAALAS
mmetsp:Transcript_67620/g.174199  ORF Transcript_67620/g.174199 Transcript_67620/m.174199 type:complete len:251 (+) Transcript_67620:112-864(+)